MLGARPGREIRAALADQLERQGGSDPIDLGQVDPEDRMQGRAHRHGRLIGLRLRGRGGGSAAAGGGLAAFRRSSTVAMRSSQAATLVW